MASTPWLTLVSGKTSAEIMTELLDALKAPPTPLPVTDWAAGAVVRSILEAALSPALSKIWNAVSSVARGGFLRLAQQLAEQGDDSWLRLLAKEKYQITPWPADFARGTLRLTNSSSAAYPLMPGQIVASTATGLVYRATNPSPVTLGAGAVRYLPIQAESPGGRYNVGPGTITVLNTALPGVTCSNQPEPPATGWLTTYGTDGERPKELADRCAARLSRINKLQTHPRDGYVSLVRDGSPVVKKVAVHTSRAPSGFAVPGAVTLYLGGETGPVAPAVATEVAAAIAPYVGINDELFVEPCTTQLIVLQGVVKVRDAAVLATTQAAVEQRIIGKQRDLDIGAFLTDWQILTMFDVPDVTDVNLLGLADVQIASNAMGVFDYSALTYEVG